MMYELKATEEFENWLSNLPDALIHSAVMTRLRRVKRGLLGDHRYISDGIFELRIFLGAGWRIYCKRQNQHIIVLLAGGSKRTQQQDIENAKTIALDLNKP